MSFIFTQERRLILYKSTFARIYFTLTFYHIQPMFIYFYTIQCKYYINLGQQLRYNFRGQQLYFLLIVVLTTREKKTKCRPLYLTHNIMFAFIKTKEDYAPRISCSPTRTRWRWYTKPTSRKRDVFLVS